MKSVSFRASIAATALLASSAALHAADLSLTPVYKAPRSVAPTASTWEGFYVGGNVGYATAKSKTGVGITDDPGTYFDPPSLPYVAAAGSGTINAKGFTGGIQAGYNWQWNRLVYGIEADANFLSLKGSRRGSATDPVFTFTEIFNQQIKTSGLVTVRPRIGYAFDRLLVYGTGGLAATQVKYSSDYSNSSGVTTGTGSASKTKIGWTLGAGAEYALSRSWSVKAEYLYADFGTVSVDTVVPNAPTPFTATVNNTADLKVQIVRVGANYRF